MFYVYDKRLNDKVKKQVYGVQYKRGYPFFTFFEDGRWVTRSAKYYVPIED